MSNLYTKSNSEKTSDLFNKRFHYKLKIRRSVSKNRHIMDFTIGEKKLYGKVDSWFSPVYVQHESKLRTIRNSNSNQPLYAFNFVADLFNEMSLDFERCVSSGQIDKNDKYLSSLTAYIAFEDPRIKYNEYKTTLFKSIQKKFISNNILVEDFDHFLREFMKIAKQSARKIPFTFSGFIKSDFNNIMTSGLAIEISDLKYEDDQEKVEAFVNSKNWKFFVNACNKYGFMIDYNVPWRIVCDVKAEEIRPALQNYYLSHSEFFNIGYSRTSGDAFSSLPRELLELYNLVKRNRFTKNIICSKRVIQKIIEPPSYTIGQIVSRYGVNYFIKTYMKLRLIEEKPELDSYQRRRIIKDTMEYIRLYNDYTAI